MILFGHVTLQPRRRASVCKSIFNSFCKIHEYSLIFLQEIKSNKKIGINAIGRLNKLLLLTCFGACFLFDSCDLDLVFTIRTQKPVTSFSVLKSREHERNVNPPIWLSHRFG